jgi:oligopeptide/dipeptide ABC transporter ATP-binding protein
LTTRPSRKITYLLRVKRLNALVERDENPIRPVDGVDFSMQAGEALGIVGETGVGKSSLARALLRLFDGEGQRVEGEITFDDEDLLEFKPEEMRRTRGKRLALLPSPPAAALHPDLTIAAQFADAFDAHNGPTGTEADQRIVEVLALVGISDPRRAMTGYADQLSTSERNRAAIALALASNPAILIADEPTRSLPAMAAADVLDVLRRLQSETDLTLILTTDDLAVAAEATDNVLVLYAGKIAEYGPVKALLSSSAHPYTQMLVASTPTLGLVDSNLDAIEGSVPPLDALPPGCRFATRCPYRMTRCDDEEPPLIKLEGNRLVRCWLY